MQMGSYTWGARVETPAVRRWGTRGAVPVQFIVEPLSAPSLVRPDHERGVLYVRLTAPRASDPQTVAVLPDASSRVRAALEEGLDNQEPVQRAVLVGVDGAFAVDAIHRELALAAFVEVVRALTDMGVSFVWRTRAGIGAGGLPTTFAHALVAAGRLCTVELGIATVDDEDARTLEGEPSTPSRARLHLASALVARGVFVRALVDPLVPMLTDQQGPLEDLVRALAAAGVRRLGARYLTLTQERARVIASRLVGMKRALLQGVFADEPWRSPTSTDPGGPREVHKRIPPALRRRGHDRLLDLGQRHGILVEILDPVDAAEQAATKSGPPPVPSPPATAAPARRPQLELFPPTKRR
jgi:hypothetical protein